MAESFTVDKIFEININCLKTTKYKPFIIIGESMRKSMIQKMEFVLLSELYEKSNNEFINPYKLSKKYGLDEREERCLVFLKNRFKKLKLIEKSEENT